MLSAGEGREAWFDAGTVLKISYSVVKSMSMFVGGNWVRKYFVGQIMEDYSYECY